MMVKKGKTTTIQMNEAKVVDLNFAAPDQESTSFTPFNRKSLLQQPVKTEYWLPPRQEAPLTGSFENKPAPLQNWHLLVDLSPTKDMALREEVRKMPSERKNLSKAIQITIKTAYHTIKQKEGRCPIRLQLYRTSHRS